MEKQPSCGACKRRIVPSDPYCRSCGEVTESEKRWFLAMCVMVTLTCAIIAAVSLHTEAERRNHATQAAPR